MPINNITNVIRKFRAKYSARKYKNLTPQQIFEKIYQKGAWGLSEDPLQPFFSGRGSHADVIVSTYLNAVQDFLSGFIEKPSVVDLGCGDFSVGSKIRHLCGKFTACDVVTKLIEFNRVKYKNLDIDFRVLDLTTNDLPSGDIVFIRQVLQHLSNEQILSALPQISLKYKFLVLTEHLPNAEIIIHNLDKMAGPDIRLNNKSGIVLTSPPFNLRPKSERMLCQVKEGQGVITTTLYELN